MTSLIVAEQTLKTLQKKEYAWLKRVTLSQFQKEVDSKEEPRTPVLDHDLDPVYKGRPPMWAFRHTRSFCLQDPLIVYASSATFYNTPPSLPANDDRWPHFIPWREEPRTGDDKLVYSPDYRLMRTDFKRYSAQFFDFTQRAIMHEEIMAFFNQYVMRGIPWRTRTRSEEDQQFLEGENRPVRVSKPGPRDCLMMHAFMAVPDSQKELASALLVDGYVPAPSPKRVRVR
eukprot:jgi/Mesvir1/26759/Mv20535-RA.1